MMRSIRLLALYCNLLNINYDAENLFKLKYMNLRVGQLLCSKSVDDVDEEDGDHNDGDYNDLEQECPKVSYGKAIPNEEFCLYSKKILRRKDDLIDNNDGFGQQRLDYNLSDYNDGYMQQRRNNDFNDGNMQQRRMSNLNDYNNDDGQQTL
ncbi:hypothetical protein CVS40_12137 [Lucilia cuprina]|nr:hypothetical protein CVS40_12137 [Lucilia cuprina]